MGWLLWPIYTAGMYAGNLYILICSAFSSKLRKISQGRKETMHTLKQIDPSKSVVWMHCASLGEFEQGRPLLEKLRSQYPDKHFVLSFFSSSGFEQIAKKGLADTVVYLPEDISARVNSLLDTVRPEIWIFVKYEFWWHLIRGLHERKVPVILISAVFRKKDYFFKPFFGEFLSLLKKYRRLFVQDVQSEKILQNHGFENVSVVGDTRVDRVIQRAEMARADEKLQTFVAGRKTIVYGSVWMSDMPLVTRSVEAFPHFAHILAPHDIGGDNISRLTKSIEGPACLYSEGIFEGNTLIIDNIGMLASAYALADYAYIGGGFEAGIHNILEPAVYGIPVFFGPRHQKFNEAVRLHAMGAATVVKQKDELSNGIEILEREPEKIQQIKEICGQFFAESKGATDKILNEIKGIMNGSDKISAF
jgi:3-deoxy-D-manno-octulosonic-acid transferase